MKYWHSESMHAKAKGKLFEFQPYEPIPIPVRGVYSTDDPKEMDALASLARDNVNGVREISKIEHDQKLSMRVRPTGRIIHAVERHQFMDSAEAYRCKVAEYSWARAYSSGTTQPAYCDRPPRTSRHIGDERNLHFLKDVLAVGMSAAESDKDIILLTNSDTIWHDSLPSAIVSQVDSQGPCSASRVEVGRWDDALVRRPVGELSQLSQPHTNRDLFAFTKDWLAGHWNDIPDFVLGAAEWDLCLGMMLRVAKGFLSSTDGMCLPLPYCELPRGLIMHITHAPVWQASRSASQDHNRRLFQKWLAVNNPAVIMPWFA